MGFYKVLTVFIVLAMLITPLAALRGGEEKIAPEEKNEENIAQPSETQKGEKDDTVKVLLTQSSKVAVVTAEEYVVGVLAAEMLPTYHEEALKAQAVAAYTYFLYKRDEQSSSPDASLNGAYLSDSSDKYQGYYPPEIRKEKWGDKAETYEKKLTKAVEAVLGKYISYDGKPIIAAFHAISSGATQSAKTVWGGEIPYLKSVTSVGDKLSPDCVQTVALSTEDFVSAAAKLDDCKLDGEAGDWLGKAVVSDSGFVKKITIGGSEYTGMQVRAAFGLRSAVFTAQYKSGSFMFTTNGFGHCVGMSQYGADYMARQGSTWEEILKHYYSGVKISE